MKRNTRDHMPVGTCIKLSTCMYVCLHSYLCPCVFVNPGTAGLGLASAVELAKKGAHVIITARSAARGEQVLKVVARQVGALNGGGGVGENFISSFTSIEFDVCQVPGEMDTGREQARTVVRAERTAQGAGPAPESDDGRAGGGSAESG